MRLRQPQRAGVKAQHKMVSDRSGFVYPANEIVRQWDGLLVHKDEEEPRHPQEFVRGVVDDYAVRNPRPRAPYEATASEQVFSLYIVDRDGVQIVDRDGEFIRTRALDLAAGDNIFQADVGSVKAISRIDVTFEYITEGKDRLNVYTSQDGVTYEPLYEPNVTILRTFTNNVPFSLAVGRLARYVALRFEPLSGTLSSDMSITQFDVIGAI